MKHLTESFTCDHLTYFLFGNTCRYFVPETFYKKYLTNIVYIAYWEFCWLEQAVIIISPKIGLIYMFQIVWFYTTSTCVHILSLTNIIKDIKLCKVLFISQRIEEKYIFLDSQIKHKLTAKLQTKKATLIHLNWKPAKVWLSQCFFQVLLFQAPKQR